MASSTSRVRKWTGFITSVICAMCCGIFLSFNVYVVALKEKFDLTQTEVGLLGSFALAGLAMSAFGYLIIKKCSYRTCYVIAWILVTSSGITMWLSTQHVAFFKKWISLMGLAQFANTAGAAMAELCCVSIGVTLFGENRIGVISGLYLAAVSFGKIYYSVIYQLFFKTTGNLGGFFFFIPFGLTVTIAICLILHRPEKTAYEKLEVETTKKCDEKSELNPIQDAEEKNDWSVMDIFHSTFFHLFIWPNAFFNAVTLSFMNNITIIAKSLEMKNPDLTVTILCIGIISTRIGFGALFDYFGTKMAGLCLLVVCYVMFGIASTIGLFSLDDSTIYVMTVFASFGIGAGFSLTLGILSFKFGSKNFAFINSVVNLLVTLASALTQILIGLTYDDMTHQLKHSSFFCKECFYWAYIIMIGQSLVCLIMGIGTMFYIKKR